MKKLLTRIICMCAVLAVLLSAVGLNASASAAYISLSPSTKTLNVGDQITVTVKYDAGQAMYSVNGSLTYTASVLQYVSGGSSNSGNSVKIVESPSGDSMVSYSIVFKAIAAGSSYLGFTMNGVNETLQKTDPASAGVNITVQEKQNPPTPPTPSTPSTPSTPTTTTPSSNASLSSLKVSGATLSPAFKASTTSYTANVGFSTESATVSGNAQDGGTCEGLGTFNLKVGDNIRYITVTAADGKTKKTYKLNIIRAAEGEEPVAPEEPTDPLAVKIGDNDYTVVAEVPTAVPAGFEASTEEVNGVAVGTLKSSDGEFVLYTLKDNQSGTTDYYTLENGKFSKLKYGVINGKMYIFPTQDGDYVAEGYTKTELNIGNSQVDAYNSVDTKLSDFYIIYCYVDGKYGYYSYDSVENTIQRAPAFESLIIPAEDEKEVISSLKDVTKLGFTGKAVIAVIFIIVVCVISLIVLVIIRYVKLRKLEDEDEEFKFDDDISLFDEINVEDNGESIDISDTEDNS